MKMFLITAIVCSCLLQAACANSPEIVLCHRSITELVDEAGWAGCRIDAVTHYIDSVNRKYTPEQMQQLTAILAERNVEVGFECGGTLGPGYGPLTEVDNGVGSAKLELKKMSKWLQAGGTISYLQTDGPVRRLLYGNIAQNRALHKGALVSGAMNKVSKEPLTIGQCAREYVSYMKEVRKTLPEVKFHLLVNFCNWGWKGGPAYHARGTNGQDYGDYSKVIPVLIQETRKAGIELSALVVDAPYGYVTHAVPSRHQSPVKVDWIARIRELEDYVESEGLGFQLIINNSRAKSSKECCENTLRYLDLYRKAGGSPERWIVQTWTAHPEKVVPASEPYTMTWLANEVRGRLTPQ